jgi:hypothetical protein
MVCVGVCVWYKKGMDYGGPFESCLFLHLWSSRQVEHRIWRELLQLLFVTSNR